MYKRQEHEYGVPHTAVEWVAELDEDVDFTPPPGLRLTRLPNDKSVETMLAEGELDAVIHSSIIKPFTAGDPRVARLWPNYKQEEIAFYKKTGIFPIMHVMGIKQEIVERHPWVPLNLMNAFNQAKAIAMKRLTNPRIVPLVLYRETWEEQEEIFGADPWEYGLGAANRHNLDTLAGYCHEHGMTPRRLTVDELFLNPTAGKKRDGVFRF